MTKHQGGCHCGAVRYEVEIDFDEAIECNCSYCEKAGMLLAFAPEAALDLRQGEERLTEYRFNKHVIAHLFCSTCGISPLARGQRPDGARMAAINVRCLDGVDLGSVKRKPFNGRAL